MSDEVASAGAPDTGLACLVLLLKFLGIAVDPEQIEHQYSKAGENISRTDILRCAKQLGVKARSIKTKWKRLEKIHLPAIAENHTDKIAAFGNAVWLMMHSKAHKHLFVTDMEWACEPPIALGQCYFWHRGHVPVGFASWAYLSEEAEKRMMQGIRKLGPADWNSGDRLWLMDLIIPFGGEQEAAKELKEKLFKDKKIKTLQPAPDGQGMAVVEW